MHRTGMREQTVRRTMADHVRIRRAVQANIFLAHTTNHRTQKENKNGS